MDELPDDLTCWIISDGKAGMENQCLGLAEALGVQAVVKRVALRRPWRRLPPQLQAAPLSTLAPDSDDVTAPWPDLLIATGRQTVAISCAVRKAAAGRAFTVQIQNPVIGAGHFDLVVAPRHDRLSGPNIISTFGALNRVQPAAVRAAAAAFAPGVAHLPCPRVAVLLGGDNKAYRMTPESAHRLADMLRQMAKDSGAGLMITPSRRTGEAQADIIRESLTEIPQVWPGRGEANPYLGWMGLADAFVVTSDSVNMISEACGVGKPVFVYHLPGGGGKFRRFHQAFEAAGMTRPFAGRLAHWTYPPLNDTATVAAELRLRLAAHLQRRDRHRA